MVLDEVRMFGTCCLGSPLGASDASKATTRWPPKKTTTHTISPHVVIYVLQKIQRCQLWFRRVVTGPSLFCALWMEAWREYKKTFFLLRKERDRVMYTSGKEGKEGVRSNIQRESPGKREMWMVTAGLARSVDEEGGGRNLLYLHNSRLIYTHTPFSPPPPPAPAWKRKKKGTLSFSLSRVDGRRRLRGF